MVDYTKIPFTISLPDDASRSYFSFITVTNFPDTCSFSSGKKNNDGNWLLNIEDLKNLYFLYPHKSSPPSQFFLHIQCVDYYGNMRNIAVNAFFFKGMYKFGPFIYIPEIISCSHSITPFYICCYPPSLSQQNIVFTIEGVPDGCFFSCGENIGDGVWQFYYDDIENIIFIHDSFIGLLPLTFTATVMDESESFSTTYDFHVYSNVQKPLTFPKPQTFTVDMFSYIQELKEFLFSDLSMIIVQGLPESVTIKHGILKKNGNWILLPHQLKNLILSTSDLNTEKLLFYVQFNLFKLTGHVHSFYQSFYVHLDSSSCDVISFVSKKSHGIPIDLAKQT